MVSKENVEEWYLNRLKKASESKRVYDVEKLADAFVAMVEFKPTMYGLVNHSHIEKINKRLQKAVDNKAVDTQASAMITLWEKAYECFVKTIKEKKLNRAVAVISKSFPAVYKDKNLPGVDTTEKRKRDVDSNEEQAKKRKTDERELFNFVRRSPRNLTKTYENLRNFEGNGVTKKDLRELKKAGIQADNESKRRREWEEEKVQLRLSPHFRKFYFESFMITIYVLFENLLRRILKTYVASHTAVDYMRLSFGKPQPLQREMDQQEKEEVLNEYATVCEQLIRLVVDKTERDFTSEHCEGFGEVVCLFSTSIKKPLKVEKLIEEKKKIVSILQKWGNVGFFSFTVSDGIRNVTKCMGALLNFVSKIESRHKNLMYRVVKENLTKIENNCATSLKEVIISKDCTEVVDFLSK